MGRRPSLRLTGLRAGIRCEPAPTRGIGVLGGQRTPVALLTYPWVHALARVERAGSGSSGVDGVDAAAILRRCIRQICRAGGGGRVFGMVGATNVANATKEFKPAQSFRLLGRFGVASGVTGTKEFATDIHGDNPPQRSPRRGFESQQPWRSSRLDPDRDDPRIHEETHTGTFGAAVERRHRRSRTPGQSTIARATPTRRQTGCGRRCRRSFGVTARCGRPDAHRVGGCRTACARPGG